MDWKTDYAGKRTTAAKALACVKSGDRVVFAHACGEPLDLVDALVARAGELERVEINHMVAMGKGEYCRPEYADAFYHKSLFVGASSRQAVKDGRGDYIPVFFSEIPKLFCEGYLTPDVVLIQVSPPDKHGFCSFGISVDYTKPAAQVAKTVIAQVNPKMPRTHGDAFIHVSEIDFIVESDQDIIELQPPRIGPVEEAIGKHIAGLVDDGSCLQLGIGGIPDAVLLFLHEKNDLGIHSEMFSEGVVDLYNEGVITNSAKSYFPGKMVATFLMGTRRLYDFVDDNPLVNMLPVNITNDPYVIGHERPRRGDQLGHPGRPDGPGRRRLHGRRPVHRHRRPGGLRPRRRPQPRRQGHHRACRPLPRREPSAASSPPSPRARRSPPCAPTSTTSSPSTGSRTCAASGCANAPRRSSRSPTPRSATRSGRRRPRCMGSAAFPATPSPRRTRAMDTKIRVHRAPKTLITGNGCVAQIGAEAKKLRATKVLILTDPGVACCGTVDDVQRPLVDAGLEVGIYDHAVPEPPMSSVHEIVDFTKQGGYDLVVGFGGGSPIDVAKVVAILATNDDKLEDYVGVDQVPKKGLPLIAVPTTAGTGSEVTAIAIFANEKLNVKQGVVSPHLIPNIALVDPVLTYSCPPNVTAASGMDALIHNIEAYISVNATMHTDPLAAEGIKLISKSIRTAVYDGSSAWARHNMAMGSLLGGIAFGNAGVGAVHAMSYPIGGAFHISHGVANTMMLPWVMEYNMMSCLQWFKEIGEFMGENMEGLSDREAAQKTVDAMRTLAEDLAVPLYLSDVGIPESAIPGLVEGALTQARLWNNNPRKFTADDMAQVYTNMAVRPGATV